MPDPSIHGHPTRGRSIQGRPTTGQATHGKPFQGQLNRGQPRQDQQAMQGQPIIGQPLNQSASSLHGYNQSSDSAPPGFKSFDQASSSKDPYANFQYGQPSVPSSGTPGNVAAVITQEQMQAVQSRTVNGQTQVQTHTSPVRTTVQVRPDTNFADQASQGHISGLGASQPRQIQQLMMTNNSSSQMPLTSSQMQSALPLTQPTSQMHPTSSKMQQVSPLIQPTSTMQPTSTALQGVQRSNQPNQIKQRGALSTTNMENFPALSSENRSIGHRRSISERPSYRSVAASFLNKDTPQNRTPVSSNQTSGTTSSTGTSANSQVSSNIYAPINRPDSQASQTMSPSQMFNAQNQRAVSQSPATRSSHTQPSAAQKPPAKNQRVKSRRRRNQQMPTRNTFDHLGTALSPTIAECPSEGQTLNTVQKSPAAPAPPQLHAASLQMQTTSPLKSPTPLVQHPTSQMNQSTGPQMQTTSPLKSPTPHVQHPTSPLKQPTGLQMQTKSPLKSPTPHVQNPTSPLNQPTGPQMQTTSPLKPPAPPVQHPTSPLKQPTGLQMQTTSPLKPPTPPVQHPISPLKQPTGLQMQTTSPLKSPTPHVQHPTSPLKQPTGLQMQTTSPLKSPTPHVQHPTSPLNQPTGPQMQTTSPLKPPTPPVQHPISPLKQPTGLQMQTTSPLKSPTPHVQHPTSPLKQPTGLQMQTTSPLKSPTPHVQHPTSPLNQPTGPQMQTTSPLKPPAPPVQHPTSPLKQPTGLQMQTTSPLKPPTPPVQHPTSPLKQPTGPQMQPLSTLHDAFSTPQLRHRNQLGAQVRSVSHEPYNPYFSVSPSGPRRRGSYPHPMPDGFEATFAGSKVYYSPGKRETESRQSGEMQGYGQNQHPFMAQETDFQSLPNFKPTQESNAFLSTKIQQMPQFSNSTPERRRSIGNFENGIQQTPADQHFQVFSKSSENIPGSTSPFSLRSYIGNSPVSEPQFSPPISSNQFNVQAQESSEYPMMQQETSGIVPNESPAVPDDSMADSTACQEASSKQKKKSRRNRKINDATPNTDGFIAPALPLSPESNAESNITSTTVTASHQITTQTTVTNEFPITEQGTSENTNVEVDQNQISAPGEVGVSESTQDAGSSSKSKKKKNKNINKTASAINSTNNEVTVAPEPENRTTTVPVPGAQTTAKPVADNQAKTTTFPLPAAMTIVSLTRAGKKKSK